MASMNDLNTLIPESITLELGGESLSISPLRVRELPAMLKAIGPFAAQLNTEPDWLLMFSEHSESLLDALSIASRQSREWVDNLAIDEALTLAATVFEVNTDFFVQRVAPNLAVLTDKLEKKVDGLLPPNA